MLLFCHELHLSSSKVMHLGRFMNFPRLEVVKHLLLPELQKCSRSSHGVQRDWSTPGMCPNLGTIKHDARIGVKDNCGI